MWGKDWRMKTWRISLGKRRALQRTTTHEGLFNILAIDHQDSLKRSLNRETPTCVEASDMIEFKRQVVSTLINEVSGVLLDPVYGALHAISYGYLGSRGLLVELEKADYQMKPLPLDVEIDPDWNVAKIKGIHADGVKLFFYYNPFNEEHAQRQETIVKQVIDECGHYDIPLYAEPIVYDALDKTQTVVKTARHISKLGADVLKLEFPVDVKKEPNEATWQAACESITQTIQAPWVLLSAGVSFELFARQLETACKAGAAGYIVGRALWAEATKISDPDERIHWLDTTGRKRVRLLNALTHTYGMPWYKRINPGSLITTSSFREYPDFKEVQHD